MGRIKTLLSFGSKPDDGGDTLPEVLVLDGSGEIVRSESVSCNSRRTRLDGGLSPSRIAVGGGCDIGLLLLRRLLLCDIFWIAICSLL